MLQRVYEATLLSWIWLKVSNVFNNMYFKTFKHDSNKK